MISGVVSTSRPQLFGPGMPVTIFRLGVFLAFLGVVLPYNRYPIYPSLPKTSSTGSFSPSDSESRISISLLESDRASSSVSVSNQLSSSSMSYTSRFLFPTLPEFPKLIKPASFAVWPLITILTSFSLNNQKIICKTQTQFRFPNSTMGSI